MGSLKPPKFLQLVSITPPERKLKLSITPSPTKTFKQDSTPTGNQIYSGDFTDPYDNNNGEMQFYNGYGEWGHVVTNTDRSISSDLKRYSLPDDIKNQADVIYNKMIYRVRRGKIRDQLLFYCVYCAHRELGRDVNPTQLGKLFDLTTGDVQRCDSIFSPLQTGYKPPVNNTSPIHYLPGYCESMGLAEEAIEEIIILCKHILNLDPDLKQDNPQTVAAGFIKYFTLIKGITSDDPQKIVTITNRSIVTIDSMSRRIAEIDNS
jgi:transcription initiation factor TFIIIB Brf1 subunit/transcription initiation factor TFIIB